MSSCFLFIQFSFECIYFCVCVFVCGFFSFLIKSARDISEMIFYFISFEIFFFASCSLHKNGRKKKPPHKIIIIYFVQRLRICLYIGVRPHATSASEQSDISRCLCIVLNVLYTCVVHIFPTRTPFPLTVWRACPDESIYGARAHPLLFCHSLCAPKPLALMHMVAHGTDHSLGFFFKFKQDPTRALHGTVQSCRKTIVCRSLDHGRQNGCQTSRR